MKLLKRYTIIGILFVAAAGSLSHFLYDWSGQNPVVGLFAPVNESVWEHMKLLFFPMLLYSAIMILKCRRQYPHIASALFFGIIIGAILIPVFYYAYTSILGTNYLVLDIGIFILSIVISFWLACKLTLAHKLESHTLILGLLVCVFLLCFLWFSYHAPDTVIFRDPTKDSNKINQLPLSPVQTIFEMF